MEVEAEKQQRGDKKEGVCVPRNKLCAPRGFEGTWRLNRNKEAFLEEAWGEEVEM